MLDFFHVRYPVASQAETYLLVGLTPTSLCSIADMLIVVLLFFVRIISTKFALGQFDLVKLPWISKFTFDFMPCQVLQKLSFLTPLRIIFAVVLDRFDHIEQNRANIDILCIIGVTVGTSGTLLHPILDALRTEKLVVTEVTLNRGAVFCHYLVADTAQYVVFYIFYVLLVHYSRLVDQLVSHFNQL